MKQFLFLLVLLFTTTVYPQQYVQKQESQIINMLSNPGYESGKTSWGTNFTNSLTVVSGTQALFGSASLKFEPQSSIFTEVYSPLLTVPQGLQGQPCNAIVNYKTNESVNYFVAKVKDASGTELITDVLLPKIIMGVPTEGANSLTLAFECPVSQQIELEISQTISGGYITLDGMHLGSKTGGLGTAEDIIDALGYTPADEVDLLAVSSTATVNTAAIASVSATTLKKASNLSDLADATTARTNLGLGTVAVENTVPTTKGGTGQTTYATGDLLVGSGTTLAKTPKGGNNQAFVTREDSTGWKEIDTSGGFNLAIDNPSFESSTTGYTTSGTVTLFRQDRQSDGVNYSPSDIKYLEIATNTNNGGACRTDTIPQNLENSNFELNFKYRTTSFAASSTMVVYQKNGTNVTSQTVSLATNSVGLNQPFIDYKAYRGVTSGTLTTCWLKSPTSLNSLDVDIDNVYVGAQKSLVNGAIVGSLINGGTITFGATTTAPTKGTINTDVVKYQRIGDSVKFLYEYKHTAAGSSGNGDYLITLPNNYTFDSTKVNFYTGSDVQSQNGYGTAKVTMTQTGNTFYGVGVVVPYDATRFRVNIIYANISTNTVYGGTFGSGTFPFSQTALTFSADFTAPITGLSGSGVSFDGRCPNDMSCENNFSATISNTGVITATSMAGWLTSCTNASPTVCQFATGLFVGSVPTCVGVYAGTGASTALNVSANTTQVQSQISGGAKAYWTLFCQKNGSDFVAKKTIQGYLSQTMGTDGRYNYITVTGHVGGASQQTACTSSPCGLFKNTSPLVTSVTMTTGAYTINFASGTFASAPVCTVRNAMNLVVLPANNSTDTATAVQILWYNPPSALTNTTFDFSCTGVRP